MTSFVYAVNSSGFLGLYAISKAAEIDASEAQVF